MVLKWSEMGWWFIAGPGASLQYLGEAGNPRCRSQVEAVRYGNEVLVSFGRENRVIPAGAAVEGFPGKRGTLAELLDEGVVYNYALCPI